MVSLVFSLELEQALVDRLPRLPVATLRRNIEAVDPDDNGDVGLSVLRHHFFGNHSESEAVAMWLKKYGDGVVATSALGQA